MAVSEKIKSKARKLKALAEQGIGGEKDAAEQKYKDFIKKHNIDESGNEIKSNNRRKFKVKDYDDCQILNNVILSVNPYTEITSYDLSVLCELDDEDYAEVKNKHSYFVKLFRIEKELLKMAFFGKHESFFAPSNYAKNKWREKKTENDELKKAREKAEDITNKAENNQEITDDMKKMKKDYQIQQFNLNRLNQMKEVLLEGKYVQNNKTIEEANL